MSQVLERCGAQSGDLNDLAKEQENLLSQLGNSWDSPLELPDRCLGSDPARKFSSSLIDALKKKGANQCSFACVHGMERILPLWQSALEKQNVVVQHLLVVRHPLAVVEQFRLTEGWDRDRALLVWLQSTLAMERHSRNFSRVIVDGEKLTWDLDGTLNQIEFTLQLTLPERHYKSLIELDEEQKEQSNSFNNKCLTAVPNQSTGSLLLTMALQLHDWLLAEHQKRERQRHLPATIREQLKLAEVLMGRTLNDLSLQNKTLENKLHTLRNRKSLRFSDWIRRQQGKAA